MNINTEMMERFFSKAQAVPAEATVAFQIYGHRARKLWIASEHLTAALSRIIASGWEHFKEVHDFHNETVLCRCLDSFETYVTDLIVEVFKVRPETLKSEDKITIEEALNYSSIPDLINYVAERKVKSLSVKGTGHLLDYLQHLGLPPLSTEERETLIFAAEVRNLITHNGAVIDERFVRKAPGGPYTIGERLESDGYWAPLGLSLLALAISLDIAAIQVHGLATTPTPREWQFLIQLDCQSPERG